MTKEQFVSSRLIVYIVLSYTQASSASRCEMHRLSLTCRSNGVLPWHVSPGKGQKGMFLRFIWTSAFEALTITISWYLLTSFLGQEDLGTRRSKLILDESEFPQRLIDTESQNYGSGIQRHVFSEEPKPVLRSRLNVSQGQVHPRWRRLRWWEKMFFCVCVPSRSLHHQSYLRVLFSRTCVQNTPNWIIEDSTGKLINRIHDLEMNL